MLKSSLPIFVKFIFILFVFIISIESNKVYAESQNKNKILELSVNDDGKKVSGFVIFFLKPVNSSPPELIHLNSFSYEWINIPDNAIGFTCYFADNQKPILEKDIKKKVTKLSKPEHIIKFEKINPNEGNYVYVSIRLGDKNQVDINKGYQDDSKSKNAPAIRRYRSAVKEAWCYLGKGYYEGVKWHWDTMYFLFGDASQQEIKNRKDLEVSIQFLSIQASRLKDDPKLKRIIITNNFPMKLRAKPSVRDRLGVMRPGTAVTFEDLHWVKQDRFIFAYIKIKPINSEEE